MNRMLWMLALIMLALCLMAGRCGPHEARAETTVRLTFAGDVTLGSEELQDMIESQHGAQVDCHFCNKRYKFSAEDLKLLLEAATIREDQ